MGFWRSLLCMGLVTTAACATPSTGTPDAGAASGGPPRADVASSATPSSPEPIDLSLDVSLADAAISGGGQYVAAVRAQGPWLGKLLVLLPEAGQPASQYRELLRVAARGGLHAVAVPQPPGPAATVLCGADPLCYGAVRGERLDGIDRSNKLQVTVADSLVQRIVQGVRGLDTAYPGLNWGQYAQGSAPLWHKLVLAGHGDGAGQAGFAATQLQVGRVVLLAGPTDGSGATPAGWLTTSHATPTAAWYALGHTADPLWPRIAAGWTALGLGAGSLSWPGIDAGAVFGVQGMTTALASAEPGLSVACDAHTPRDGEGRPRYRVAWQVLMGGAPF
jgi:hypothetical protein